MWRNYLTVTLRRLAQNRGYSLVTIGGLALGLAGCLLILGYIRYERSWDAWVPGHDRVFQAQSIIHAPGKTVHGQTSSFAFYDRFAPSFPQVEAVTSISVGKTVAQRDGKPQFIEVATVDPNFFQVFPLAFAQGSAATALRGATDVVMTEAEATRWFGTPNALGRTLALGAGEGRRDHRVSAVLKDLPPNTNLKLGLIFHRDVAKMSAEQRQWSNFDQQHFVRLKPGVDVAAINAGLPAWEKRVIPDAVIGGKTAVMSDAFNFRLVPIADVHLGEAQEGAFVPGGDPKTLGTFAVVALLILAMAIINFVNLSTARAIGRAREVALRKVLGATRAQLIVQFLVEGLMIAGLATLIAFTLVELATPAMGRLLGADLPIAYLGQGGMLLPALALLAVTGVIGGLLPALRLSGFKPAAVLRANQGASEAPGSARLRAVLVVAQFAIAIGLIASTAVIWSQTRFAAAVDPGYRRDGLIQIANAWRFTQGAEYREARRAMLAIPGVTLAGRTGLALGSLDKSVRLVRNPGAASYEAMQVVGVDAELLPTLGARLLAGRLPGDRFAADRLEGQTAATLTARGLNLTLNRAGARALGHRAPADAIGKPIQLEFEGGTMVPATITGVVEDTRYRSIRDAVDPMIYAYDPVQTSQVLVRYADARPGEVMAGLERIWRWLEPEIPFEARFADDIVYELYQADRARMILFAGFALLAVAIACLGLYGLAAFAVARRTKEIGIRKVLGARVRDIVRLLAWQFSKPVVVANLVAWPLAWWAMRDWLNGFDARVALTPTPFVAAGLLALVIALATVAGHAIRAARTNPIHALRYE